MHNQRNNILPAPSAAANGYSYASLPLTAFDLLERTPSEIATLAVCGPNARQGV